MELLDGMFSDDPRQQAMLTMAMGLLGSGGKSFGSALGNAGLLGQQAYSAGVQRQAKLAEEKQQQEMRVMQMAQMKAQQEAQARQQAQVQSWLQTQPPEVQQRFGVDPQGAVKQAFPDPVKPKMAFAPNGQAVDMNALQPGGNYAATPDWKNPEYRDWMMQKARAGASQVTTNVMPPREVFKDSMALKKDFDGQPEVKGFKEVQGAWDQISTALKNPSAANDLAAATKFMKLLDPGSVVRESELAMAMQASGKLDQFMNLATRIKTGQKLTPSQREDFYKSGRALYEAASGRYQQSVDQYNGIAGQYGLDKQFIAPAKQAGAPKPGTVDGDYYFKGGDPGDRNNWVKRK